MTTSDAIQTDDGPFSDERMVDLLVTALEGGIGYWARAYEYEYEGDDPHATVVDFLAAFQEDSREPVGYAELDDLYERGFLKAFTYRVDLPLLRNTVIKALHGGFGKNGTHYAAEFVAENEDATTADVLFQLATLGELTYG